MRKCVICNKQFNVPKCAPNKKYCSKKCKGKDSNKRQIKYQCSSCGKEFLGWRGSKNREVHYCSRKCFAKAPRPGRRTYTVGKSYVMTDGYIYTYMPEHQGSNIKGLIAQHRLVMEENLGRFLTKTEVVHHINGDVSDNRLENLMLFSSNGEHTRFHKEQKRQGNQNSSIVSTTK